MDVSINGELYNLHQLSTDLILFNEQLDKFLTGVSLHNEKIEKYTYTQIDGGSYLSKNIQFHTDEIRKLINKIKKTMIIPCNQYKNESLIINESQIMKQEDFDIKCFELPNIIIENRNNIYTLFPKYSCNGIENNTKRITLITDVIEFKKCGINVPLYLYDDVCPNINVPLEEIHGGIGVFGLNKIINEIDEKFSKISKNSFTVKKLCGELTSLENKLSYVNLTRFCEITNYCHLKVKIPRTFDQNLNKPVIVVPVKFVDGTQKIVNKISELQQILCKNCKVKLILSIQSFWIRNIPNRNCGFKIYCDGIIIM